jgi:4-amino-4-deoxy-L-arabinose transferase-like glycosyltransferase
MIHQGTVSEIQPRRYTQLILLLILLLAAFLRLVKLGQISPPGLNQDEAVNTWNAYCLLKTGKDQVGARWPIFYIHALGDNRSALYVYTMIPFLAAGGLSIWTARLVSAAAGILCIPLIYLVASRLFDRRVGLAAAALLALNPWHLHISRWAVEAILCPLVSLLILAMMLWAKMPIKNGDTGHPRPLPAMAAGALAGIGCYGYPAIRLFIPIFLVLIVLVTFPAWRRSLKTRSGFLAIAAFIIAFASTFGPLAFKHLTDPENISKRAGRIWIWEESDSTSQKIQAVFARYLEHFGPDFLFIRGDHSNIQSPPNAGQYHWYELPIMLAGLIILSKTLKTSYAARILLVFLLVYPVGDCLSFHYGTDVKPSLHAFRSAPGLCGPTLLAAVGAVGSIAWLYKKRRKLAPLAIAVLVIAAIGINGRYFYHFYGEYNRRPEIYYGFHTDLIEACQWLRPRFNDFDAVFCTTKGFNMPYVVTTVALGYDPRQWFAGGFDFTTQRYWDFYTRYGKMYFMYDKFFKPPVEKTYPPGRTLFIVRPGELNFESIPSQLVHKIIGPDGGIALLLYQV